MDCLPPPPPPVVVAEGAEVVEVPVVVVGWLAARDVHAELVTACYLDQRATLTLVEAERDAAVWLAEQRSAELAQMQRRPRWGTVAAAGGVGVVVGVVVVAVSLR